MGQVEEFGRVIDRKVGPASRQEALQMQEAAHIGGDQGLGAGFQDGMQVLGADGL